MGLKTETRTIGEHEYETTQLGAVAGREALRRLLKMSTTAFSRAGSAWKGGGPAENMVAIAQGAMGLVQELEGADLDYFCTLFGKNSTVTIGGKHPKVADVFDYHFAGNYLEMTLWLAFCAEVNFGGFFKDALTKLNSLVPAQETPPAE
jgi:hypothetical protein